MNTYLFISIYVYILKALGGADKYKSEVYNLQVVRLFFPGGLFRYDYSSLIFKFSARLWRKDFSTKHRVDPFIIDFYYISKL